LWAGRKLPVQSFRFVNVFGNLLLQPRIFPCSRWATAPVSSPRRIAGARSCCWLQLFMSLSFILHQACFHHVGHVLGPFHDFRCHDAPWLNAGCHPGHGSCRLKRQQLNSMTSQIRKDAVDS